MDEFIQEEEEVNPAGTTTTSSSSTTTKQQEQASSSSFCLESTIFVQHDHEEEEEEEEERPGGTTNTTQKDDGASASPHSSCSRKWTYTIVTFIHRPVLKTLLAMSHHAATHPVLYVVGIIALSFALVAIGFFTDFNVHVDEDVVWTPFGCKPIQHMNWIDDESGYPPVPGRISLFVHAQGENVLGRQGVERVFQAMNIVQTADGYQQVCIRSNAEDTADCSVQSVTDFWNGNLTLFQRQVQSDEQAILAMSANTFPDGSPVSRDSIFGIWEATTTSNGTDDTNRNNKTSSLLTTAQAYSVLLFVADDSNGADFEKPVIEAILELRDEWAASDSPFRLEISATRSLSDEFERAIVNDIPLIPASFVIMALFAAFVFLRRDKVQSRTLLGFGAVVSVLLSIVSGYGLLFLIGVPFTSITPLLPFVVFGIGLDDIFILTGEYKRTDLKKDPVDRIHDTVEKVGVSIFLTTLTSTLAFALGCSSSIPTIHWLCLYAFPTILFDFLYQLTFFVALLVIDERRLRSKRLDCFVCLVSTSDSFVEEGSPSQEKDPEEEEEEEEKPSASNTGEGGMADHFMTWYAKHLLRPEVKVAILVAFTALFAGCVYSASRLRQELDFTDILPDDSYLKDFFNTVDDYAVRSDISPGVYFRYLDQSDPDVQQQMEDYVNQIVGLDEVSKQPEFFWLRDFHKFVEASGKNTAGLAFNEQVQVFLQDPVYRKLYLGDIVFNERGDISTSRLEVFFDGIVVDDIKDQIEALENQREVTEAQPANQGLKDWAMFTYSEEFNVFEFYSVAVKELILTTFVGVVAVSVVGLVFIPHWSAVLYVAPMIIVLYVDMLGVMQFSGLHINPVSYLAMVMSIGLLVDFIMHVILRYFEFKGSRDEKVEETLRTMGSSIFIGGISTFLGVVPLAFSTSEIFATIFTTFLALVTLGMGHGLILVPVILSMVGTTESIAGGTEDNTNNKHNGGKVDTSFVILSVVGNTESSIEDHPHTEDLGKTQQRSASQDDEKGKHTLG